MSVTTKSADTWAGRTLGAAARSVCRHPALYLYSQIGLAIVGVLITTVWPRLGFDASRDNLVGAKKRYHQLYLRFKAEFPAQDDLVTVVESEDMEKNRQFVERLGRRLTRETNLFTDVLYKNDFTSLGKKGLLFASETNLVEMRAAMKDFSPFIQQFTKATNFVGLFNLINSQIYHAKREANEENKALMRAFPALERIIVQARDAIGRPGFSPAPGLDALFGGGEAAETNMYVTFEQGRLFLVTARALTEDANDEAVEELRKLVEQTKAETPGVNVGVTGEPIIEHDEMVQVERDMSVASVVSLALCALIFIYGYREIGRPIKATSCLLIGLSYTMALTTLVVGHLNLLTVTFAPILIGLAIDFGVHFITRYEEELRSGKSREAAIEKAMIYTGQGIFTGALTTSGAFLAMGLTSFKGIQEMGIICGGGLMLCLVPMMTALPALLLMGRRKPTVEKPEAAPVNRARIEEIWLKRPVIVAGVTAALCAVSVVRFGSIYFDYNLLHMQSAGVPAVVYEEKLFHSAAKSVLFAAVIATNLDEAVDLEARILKLPTVENVDSMSKYIGADQTGKLEQVRLLKREIAEIQFPPADPNPVNIPELSRVLWSFQGYLGNVRENVEKEDPKFAAQVVSLYAAVGDFRAAVLRDDDSNIAPRLLAFQTAFFSDIRETFEALQGQDDSSPLRAGDLPAALRHRFIGVTGKYLLQVYPKEDVRERGPQERFIRDVRTVYPDLTGTPVQLYEYTTLLKNSYEEAAVYSLIAIAIMVLLHFRSVACVILALLPVAIGSVWMGGFMGWFGVPFNPANIMTLPLVIGIGVTNGIHILNRFAEERSPDVLGRSTGKAVLVSGLTAISGFGSLLLAKHHGIQSLGMLMSVGITTCMLAALTFLPASLALLIKSGWMIKKTQ
jgi:hopanoid biosynthesis associated RND transporter like protein HpnN